MAKVRLIAERHPEDMEAKVNEFLDLHYAHVIQYKTLSQFAAITIIVYDVDQVGDISRAKVKLFTGQINDVLETEMNNFLSDKKFIEIQSEIVNEYEVTYMITYEE